MTNRGRPLVLTSVIAVAAFSLLAAGCGGEGSPRVANVAGSDGSSGAGGATSSRTMLAYARCMRSHEVPTFPDPDSSGRPPKAQVVDARKSNPTRFDAANDACTHLLPNSGDGPSQAKVQQQWSDDRDFARCMRAHGVSNFPDPTSVSTSDRRPHFDLQAVGIDLMNSPQVRTKALQCQSQLHLTELPPAH